MNKLTIPALLAATIMVAGAFAFMPVEQASTVHLSGTITTTSTADTTAILADTAVIGAPVGASISVDIASVQTDSTAILADTAVIGALVGGATSMNADIDNTQNQIAALVETDTEGAATVANLATVTVLDSGASLVGLLYVTVCTGGSVDGGFSVAIDGNTVGTVTGTNTCTTFAAGTTATGTVVLTEIAGGGSTSDLVSALVVVLASSPDTT